MPQEESLASNVLALGELLRRLITLTREAHELPLSQFIVLRILGTRGRQTMSQLTQLMETTKGNLTYHIDRLEVAGLVNRMSDPTDRRLVYIEPTETGIARHKAVIEDFQLRLERFTERIPPTEATIIRAGLELLRNHAQLLLEDEPETGEKGCA